jgi:hypothetical protein
VVRKRLAIVCGFFACFALWSALETNLARSVLPIQIETTGFANVGQDNFVATILALMVPLRAETCGGALHNLSSRTRQAIEKSGIQYLADARTPRASEQLGRTSTFEKWIETGPNAGVGDKDGPVAKALDCMGIGASLGSDILRALREPGSYYSRGTKRTLVVVLPALDMVAYAWDDANHRPPPCSRVSPDCPWSD